MIEIIHKTIVKNNIKIGKMKALSQKLNGNKVLFLLRFIYILLKVLH